MSSKSYNSAFLPSLQNKSGIQMKKTRWDLPGHVDRSFTPLTMTPPPRNNPLVTPTRSLRRYSLADVDFMTPPYERNRHSSLQNVYNTPNLSYTCAQIDSKSPGFAGRVVQYNEEAKKSFPISQMRYNKPGMFPVVHLFKKDLPSPQRKPSHVKMRMNSPELSKFNTPEQNRMLLETIIHSTPENRIVNPQSNEVHTKSVLDALKEISRKRIHSNEEEFVSKDDGKQACMDYISNSNARKKAKLNLSQLEDSPSSKSIGRYNSMDELRASFSSMEGEEISKPKVEKATITPRPVFKNHNRATFTNAETQTIIATTQTAEASTETKNIPEEKENLKATTEEKKTKKVSPLKVFDETPLEKMRKNRLLALMGSLNGVKEKEKQIETPTANEAKKVDEIKTTTEKPLVSILSGPAKSPNKSKHVTFNIPETVASTTFEVSQAPVESSVTTFDPKSNGYDLVTKTSTSLITPIVSSTVVESSAMKKTDIQSVPPTTSFTAATSGNNQFQLTFSSAPSTQPNFTLTPPTQSFSTPQTVSPVATTNTSAVVAPSFSFGVSSGLNAPVDNSKLNGIVSTSGDAAPVSGLSAFTAAPKIPTFSFGTKPDTSTPKTTSESPKGGFKFDLKSYAPSPTPGFPFSNSSQAASNPNKVLFNTTATLPQVTTTAVATIAPNFALLPMSSAATAVTTSSAPKPFQLSGGFASGGGAANFSSNVFPTSKNNFTPSNAVAPVNFGIITTPATTGSASFSSTFSKPPMSLPTNTSTNQNTATSSSFMPPNSLAKSPVFTFGPNPTTKANPASSSTPFAVGFGSNSPGMFGSALKPATVTTASATPFFGTVAQSTTSSGTAGVFNKPITSFNSNPPFGGAAFGGTTNNTRVTTNNGTNFGTAPPSFNSNNSVFGGNTLQVPSFGADTSTKPAFGQAPVPQFGAAAATTASTVFGSGASTFGTANAFQPPATTTGANIFGNTNPSSFGTNTPTPIFRSPTTTTAPAFGATTNFTTNTFGSSQNPGFNSNPQPSSFGNVFGALATTSGATSDFGSRPFNQTSNMFSGFGTDSAALKPNSFETTTPFQGATSGFGGSSFAGNPPTTQGEVFTFGQAANKPAVFSFGSSEPPKPSFNFAGADSGSSAFGGANKGFGSGFGAPAAQPQFNVQPGPPGMFNIGTGSGTPTTRSRTQLKAKRRT